MTKQTEALKLALEALTYCEALNSDVELQKTQAIAAIKEALAESHCCGECDVSFPCYSGEQKCIRLPQQEPVALMVETEGGTMYWPVEDYRVAVTYCAEGEAPIGLHRAPPQHQWIGLTKDDILEALGDTSTYRSKYVEFARVIETKLKEKNT